MYIQFLSTSHKSQFLTHCCCNINPSLLLPSLAAAVFVFFRVINKMQMRHWQLNLRPSIIRIRIRHCRYLYVCMYMRVADQPTTADPASSQSGLTLSHFHAHTYTHKHTRNKVHMQKCMQFACVCVRLSRRT